FQHRSSDDPITRRSDSYFTPTAETGVADEVGIVAATVSFDVSIFEILFESRFTTSTPKLFVAATIATGALPTVTVRNTVSFVVLITETVFEPLLATYTRVPSGSGSIATGALPTGTVASNTGGFASALNTLSVLAPVLAT